MPADNWANGRLIREVRDRLKLTREGLANRSGLSVRVIAKAEASESVAPRTIEALGHCFRQLGAEVSDADLCSDPESLARRLLQAYADHHGEWVEAVRDIISPDLEAHVAGDPATNPIAGVYHGVDAFAELWRTFFRMFRRDSGELNSGAEMRTDGREVFAWGYEWVHLPEFPAERPGFVMLRMLFKDGQLVYFEDHYESTGMMEVINRCLDRYPNAEWAKAVRNKVQTPPEWSGAVA